MRSQVAIKAIDNEYTITLITQIFEKFSRSNRYRDNRDNRQVSTSLKRFHVLIINRFYRNFAPRTRKNGSSLKENTSCNDERCSYLTTTSKERKEDKGLAAKKRKKVPGEGDF